MSIPRDWQRVTLREVVSPRRGKVIPNSKDHRPYLSLDNIESGTATILGWESASQYRSQAAALFPGDVAYVRLRPYLNKVALVDRESLGSAELIVLPQSETLFPGFLVRLLSSRDFVAFAIDNSTGDRPRLTWPQMQKFRFSLPPLAEQIRISSAIDKSLTTLDTIHGLLDVVSSKVETLRNSIVSRACSGQLIAEEASGELASALCPYTEDSHDPSRRTEGSQCEY